MKVLSVSSEFSIKGVMEFCTCFQLSALYCCSVCSETLSVIGNFVLFPHLPCLWRTQDHPQKHCVKLSSNLWYILVLTSSVFRAGAEPTPIYLFLLWDFLRLVSRTGLRFSNACIGDNDNFYHTAVLEWAGWCWIANILSKSFAWVTVNKSSLHCSFSCLPAPSSHWIWRMLDSEAHLSCKPCTRMLPHELSRVQNS